MLDFYEDKSVRICRFLEESSQEDPEMTLVKETPGMGFNGTTASSGSFSKDGNSSLTMIQASVEHTDQESSYSVSLTNASKDPGKACCSLAVTPKKDFNANTCSLIPEAESTLNLSVNSHTQKKRQPIGLPFINLVEGPDSPDMESPGCFRSTTDTMASKDANRRIEFDLATDSAEHQSMESKAPRVLPTNNCAPSSINSDPVMDQKLQISCSLCKSPLGLPVLMADIASVDQRLYNITLKDNPGRGVWCEEDGCVFNSIYCPFCSSSNCLGVQIMATDASNVQLLNKILFYFDGLEIQNLEASTDRASKQKEVHSPSMDKTAAFNSIDRFSYSPHQNSGGWRTTRPKLKLPKRDRLLNGQSQN